MKIVNKAYVLELDDASGSIKSFSNGCKEFMYSGENSPLFILQLRDESEKPLNFTSFDASGVDMTQNEAAGEACIQIRYTEIRNPLLNACVTIRCPKNSPRTYWRITVDNTTGWLLDWIDFPGIVVPNDLTAKGGTGKIVWPFNEGVLVEDTSIREATWFKYIEPNYPSRGVAGIYPAIVPAQFMAYYEERGGLYIGAHDPHGHVKCVEYYPVDEGIRLQFRLYPGGGEYEMDYDMVLAVLAIHQNIRYIKSLQGKRRAS